MRDATQVKDYYKILGVDSDADAAEIRRVYRKLARQYHPDRNKDPEAEDRFKEIGEAYEVLKDEKKRQAYDQIRQGGPFHGFGAGQGNWGGDGFQFDGDPEELSDLFETLFGGGFAGGGARAGRRPRPQAGGNIAAELEVGLETAYRGGTRRIDVGGRSLDVKIPAGVLDGQKIRLKGQGQPGLRGGPAGDLILTVRHRADPRFRVEGRDLHTRVNIACWEAALGGKIPVQTLSGSIDLKVPAGARSGQKMRAKGRGMPGSPAGDLFVELMIQTPPAEDDQLRELYAQLRDRSGFEPR